MSSRNRVELIGYVGGAPETRHTNSGTPVSTFSIATSETWRDKNTGEQREATEWHRIVVWGEGLITKVIQPYVRKGSRLLVEGALKTRKWSDQNDVERYVTEVIVRPYGGEIMLLSSPDRANSGGARRAEPEHTPPRSEPEPFDDDIPF